MLIGLFLDLSFWSAFIGFIGVLIVKGYECHLDYEVNRVEKNVQLDVELANSEQDKSKRKLDGFKKISHAKRQKEVFLSKVSDRVLLVLIVAFGLSLGGIVMSNKNSNELESRINNIESYLWPSGGPGGGTGDNLSEKINSLKESVSTIQSMQTEIINTIYEQVKTPSEELLRDVERLNQEIKSLEVRIKVLERQQGGAQATTVRTS